jgi:chemotaxis protein CheD
MMTNGGSEPRIYWDSKINSKALIVLPGDHYVTNNKDLALVTLLGSCVAACIRDTQLGLGGLNHFLLPGDSGLSNAGTGDGGGVESTKSMRYGVFAMEALVNDIIRRGGSKSNLEAKVFGAGNVIDTSASETVGEKNANFVVDYLRREGVQIAAQDLGGARARRIFFFPKTGRVLVLRLEPTIVRDQEMRLKARVEKAPKVGSVELFV